MPQRFAIRLFALTALVLCLAAPALAADAPADTADLETLLATPAPAQSMAGDPGTVGDSSHCVLISNYCSGCANYQVRSCDRYRCQVGPDVWYETSCTSCGPFC